MRHAQHDFALTPEVALFVVFEMNGGLGAPMLKLGEFSPDEVRWGEAGAPALESADGCVDIAAGFEREDRPGRASAQVLTLRTARTLLRFQGNQEERFGNTFELQKPYFDASLADHGCGTHGMRPLDAAGVLHRRGIACRPSDYERGLLEAEGHEDALFAGWVVDANDVRVGIVVSGWVLWSRRTTGDLLEKVGGLDAFAERVVGIGLCKAVGMRIEAGDRAGIGRDDGEAEAIAGDEVRRDGRRRRENSEHNVDDR